MFGHQTKLFGAKRPLILFMANKVESSIFVLDPIKGEFWHFKVERRVLTSGTVRENI